MFVLLQLYDHLSCRSVNYMHVIDHGRKYIEKNFERPFFDRVIRNFLSVVLPNTKYTLELASFFVKIGKPFQFLMPSKIKRYDEFNANIIFQKKL